MNPHLQPRISLVLRRAHRFCVSHLSECSMVGRFRYSTKTSEELARFHWTDNGVIDRYAVGDGQLDLRSGTRAAPNSESRAKFLCSFAHAGKSPMSFASRMQHVRIDPTAVVADD